MLVLLLLAAENSPFFFSFLTYSSIPCLDVSTLCLLQESLHFSFLETSRLSMLFLECKALCIVINFLVLWYICLSSSLLHFKDGPEYLTRRTAQEFIALMRFLLQRLVLNSFLILLRYSFLIFLSFLFV